ncbi:hypothetical protein MHA_1597 [Mannheimia haemolytica PHL213]|nr:hypothetical protein MHA_1597 [Mannheimia haemolytica PHL213]
MLPRSTTKHSLYQENIVLGKNRLLKSNPIKTNHNLIIFCDTDHISHFHF